MSSVLDRSALEQSPLADLHVLANELGVDGYRRLRKADLVDAILARQSGEEPEGAVEAPEAEDAAVEAPDAVEAEDEGGARGRRSRRGGRGRARGRDEESDEDRGGRTRASSRDEESDEGEDRGGRTRARGRDEESGEDRGGRTRASSRDEESGEDRGGRTRARSRDEESGEDRGGRTRARGRDEESDEDRGGRGRGRGRGRDRDEGDAAEPAPRGRGRSRDDEGGEDRQVEGVVELLSNGSGFVRLSPPESTDDDVYVSAAQVKRCELVSGDRVAGPVRTPRRSERFPSMIRIDTINGRPADEVAEGTRFEDLPVAFPDQHIELGSEDPTVKALEWLTPFGKGSRVTIVGGARSGKSEALRRLAGALAGRDGLEVTVVLAGVRPEEAAEWREGPLTPTAALSFAASADAQAQAVEQAVEQGRRVAARGGDAVVLVDSLEYLTPGAARRALAAARNIVDGGSLTVVATAAEPLGGETTVVALDAAVAAAGRFPALDLTRSGTLRPERLVGDAGAEAIAKARAEAAAG